MFTTHISLTALPLWILFSNLPWWFSPVALKSNTLSVCLEMIFFFPFWLMYNWDIEKGKLPCFLMKSGKHLESEFKNPKLRLPGPWPHLGSDEWQDHAAFALTGAKALQVMSSYRAWALPSSPRYRRRLSSTPLSPAALHFWCYNPS